MSPAEGVWFGGRFAPSAAPKALMASLWPRGTCEGVWGVWRTRACEARHLLDQCRRQRVSEQLEVAACAKELEGEVRK